MRATPDPDVRAMILQVVEDALAESGYDRLRLRDVANRARVSLSTIYKLFGTREALIVAAMERWMADNGYVGLTPPFPEHGVYDGLLHIFRSVFEPWERNSRMLEAFHRARTGPGGDRLAAQGAAAIDPALAWVFRGAEPAYVADLQLLIRNVFYAVFGRFADGELEITEVLPTLERVAFRLTANNAAEVKSSRATRSSR